MAISPLIRAYVMYYTKYDIKGHQFYFSSSIVIVTNTKYKPNIINHAL